MPKPTYWNLPEEKRAALRLIALEEFAARDFQNASISRIVARMGIAKGSLYQYFEDKQDLYLYLLDDAQAALLALLQEAPRPASAGFFDLLRAQMSATVQAALALPLQSQLIQRAYGQHAESAPLPFRSEVIEAGRRARAAYLRKQVEDGVAAGELNPSVPVDVIVLVVSGAISEIGPYLLQKLGGSERADSLAPGDFQSPAVEATFDAVIAALRGGLGVQKYY